jgi:hypothetical protein
MRTVDAALRCVVARSRFVREGPIFRGSNTPGVSMPQLAVLYVAAFVGFVAYNEAARFERQYHTRPWRARASTWGIVCVLLGPVGALLLLIAQDRTRRRVIASTSSSTRALQQSVVQSQWAAVPPQASVPSPQQLSAPQLPSRLADRQPSAPSLLRRHWVPQQPQPRGQRSQQLCAPRPHRHPSDARKLYLFGVPESQQDQAVQASSGWSCQYPAPASGNGGGTDLLPTRSQHGAPSGSRPRKRHVLRGD